MCLRSSSLWPPLPLMIPPPLHQKKAPTHLVIATVTFQLALASSFAAVLESVRVTCMTSSMYCLCSVALGAGIVKARQSCGRLSK
jgi:hypothetical protein